MKLKLINFEGKKVRLVNIEGEVFKGYVGDYIYPEDNEPEGVEGIVLDSPQRPYPIGFNEPEIKSIEIIP